MTGAHRRKKQPALVRRALIENAEVIALHQGLGAVTVQAVAKATGVTKGGFFHHFPSKQALLEAVVEDMLGRFAEVVEREMAGDVEPWGRFTRAYVAATFADPAFSSGGQWSALHVSMMSEPTLRRIYTDWIDEKLSRFLETDGAPELRIVRLAADGAWLANLLRDEGSPPADFTNLQPVLLAMTRRR
jgi:AcrR family transcriptional regulator